MPSLEWRSVKWYRPGIRPAQLWPVMGKNGSSNLFDITKGSYDSAETSKLVGTFLLHNIKEKYGNNFGLHRDDAPGRSNSPPCQVEFIKKDLCKILSEYGLMITIEVNKKIINLHDVSPYLSNGTYSPYSKPNIPLYINKKFKYPLQIIKKIPVSINKRLAEISYDKASFNKATPINQKAVKASRYKHYLKFSTPFTLQPTTPKEDYSGIHNATRINYIIKWSCSCDHSFAMELL